MAALNSLPTPKNNAYFAKVKRINALADVFLRERQARLDTASSAGDAESLPPSFLDTLLEEEEDRQTYARAQVLNMFRAGTDLGSTLRMTLLACNLYITCNLVFSGILFDI